MSIEAMKQALSEAQMLVMPVPAKEVTALEIAKAVSERAVKLCTLLEQAIAEGHDMDKPEWQGLKPEEIEKLAKWADEHGHGPFHTDFAFAIDRLLRGKNLRRGEISQEPVAILNHAHGVHVFRNVKLNGLPDGEYAVYTHPQPKREWVGLTDEQIHIRYKAMRGDKSPRYIEIYRDCENAHGIKGK